jgi:hypothetical protein
VNIAKGGVGAFGACYPFDTNFQSACSSCNGNGYTGSAALTPAPAKAAIAEPVPAPSGILPAFAIGSGDKWSHFAALRNSGGEYFRMGLLNKFNDSSNLLIVLQFFLRANHTSSDIVFCLLIETTNEYNRIRFSDAGNGLWYMTIAHWRVQLSASSDGKISAVKDKTGKTPFTHSSHALISHYFCMLTS